MMLEVTCVWPDMSIDFPSPASRARSPIHVPDSGDGASLDCLENGIIAYGTRAIARKCCAAARQVVQGEPRESDGGFHAKPQTFSIC